MAIKEYTSVVEVAGPLMIVEGVEGIMYGEVACTVKSLKLRPEEAKFKVN